MERKRQFNEMTLMEETARCLLCYDAPCSKACPLKASPADFIRSLRFKNLKGALKTAYKNGECSVNCVKSCEGRYCEKACLRVKIDTPIKVKAIHEYLVCLAELENVCEYFKDPSGKKQKKKVEGVLQLAKKEEEEVV